MTGAIKAVWPSTLAGERREQLLNTQQSGRASQKPSFFEMSHKEQAGDHQVGLVARARTFWVSEGPKA